MDNRERYRAFKKGMQAIDKVVRATYSDEQIEDLDMGSFEFFPSEEADDPVESD